MPTRAEHLEDMRTRLTGRISGVEDNVDCSRIVTASAKSLPSICLYGPAEDSGDAMVTGGHAQYQPTHTLCAEVRVPFKDGFDVTAGAIVRQILQLLLGDSAWTTRFKPHPVWKVNQFLDRKGEDAFCGEILTLTVRDRLPTSYPPTGPLLAAITTAADVDGDGTGDVTATAQPKEA